MVTSADMHRAWAKDLRQFAVILAVLGALALGVSIVMAGYGSNAALVLLADGIGLCLGWSSAYPWIRAKEERAYAKSLDIEDGIVDTRAMWRDEWRAAQLDQCECRQCKPDAVAS